MELHFRNSYGATINVAVMFFEPDGCRDDGHWGTQGWWVIPPGGRAHVLNTNNRFAAYYAEAVDGATWTGDQGPMYVYTNAFNSCVNIGSTAAQPVLAKLVDMDGKDMVINLVT